MGTTGSGEQPPYLCIHAVNIYVRDQERSLRFYVDQLGFRVAFDARVQSGQRWVAVAPPDGTTVLALIAPTPGSPEHKFIGRATQVVLITEDVMSKFQEWSGNGVRFGYTPRLRRIKYDQESSPTPSGAPVWGAVSTRFEDPDRNSFALVSFDEVSRAVQAQRRIAAEKADAERRAMQELEIATQVQARLFPQTLPPCRSLEYAGICVQARQVGGDYYDFLNLGRDRLGLVIGDIAGKGMAAALLMANLQANLRSQCAIALDEPQRFLRSVNQLFYENTKESAYATLFFAEYDDASQRLRYANCGHLCALLLRSTGHLERLESTSTVLGLFRDWDCLTGECRLSEGDTLALYTDGITEACNATEEEFGEDRLVHALRRHRELPPRNMLQAVLGEVQQFSPQEQQDDITLMIARCKG
jgi:serine phosphatase RsbU (regulator of sigma subunit)/catechol 2,3-dioxygenase-like lactoylglutathione lyase family enzyme